MCDFHFFFFCFLILPGHPDRCCLGAADALFLAPLASWLSFLNRNLYRLIYPASSFPRLCWPTSACFFFFLKRPLLQAPEATSHTKQTQKAESHPSIFSKRQQHPFQSSTPAFCLQGAPASLQAYTLLLLLVILAARLLQTCCFLAFHRVSLGKHAITISTADK